MKTVLRAVALRTVWLVSFALFMLARTWRIEVEGWGPISREHERGDSVIYAVGHGRMLVCYWLLRHRGVCLLISEHFDGELIARIVAPLGFGAVRGSATRGGAVALLKFLRSGVPGDFAFTPDGPKGPLFDVKPGLAWLAARTGRPIATGSWDADRRFEAWTWDRFRIPLPGARVRLVVAPLRRVAADARGEALEAERRGVEADLLRCEARAMAAFGRTFVPPARGGPPTA